MKEMRQSKKIKEVEEMEMSNNKATKNRNSDDFFEIIHQKNRNIVENQ